MKMPTFFSSVATLVMLSLPLSAWANCEVVTMPPPSTVVDAPAGAAAGMPPELYGHTATPEHINGLYPPFAQALARVKAAMAANPGGNFTIFSGFRSITRQNELFNGELAKQRRANPGASEATINRLARRNVAPPGSSNHNFGIAVDIRYNGSTPRAGSEGDRWLAGNLARFGLMRRMSHEPWHIEPVNVWELREQLKQGAATAGIPVNGSEPGAAPGPCSHVEYDMPIEALMPWGGYDAID